MSAITRASKMLMQFLQRHQNEQGVRVSKVLINNKIIYPKNEVRPLDEKAITALNKEVPRIARITNTYIAVIFEEK